jgi:hypothetical protein
MELFIKKKRESGFLLTGDKTGGVRKCLWHSEKFYIFKAFTDEQKANAKFNNM